MLFLKEPHREYFSFSNVLLKPFPYQYHPLYLGEREENASVINEDSKQQNVAKSICLAKQFLWQQQLESITGNFHIVMPAQSQLLELEFRKKSLELHTGAKKDQFDQKWLHFTNHYAITLCLKISSLGGVMV